MSELRMVAIFRGDVTLPPGKMAVQAGHAFLAAWRRACIEQPSLAEEYDAEAQMKIVMVAPDLDGLLLAEERAARRKVPSALITDAARTVLAVPTVTVLGLGPMTKTDSNAVTRGLSLL